MRVYVIAAYDRNRVIGINGKIPWKIKGEQKQFKELTMGNAVVMGRNTYEEIGHPLPDRLTIVVSKTKAFEGENLTTAASLGDAILKAKEMGYDDIFIAGGQKLYEEGIKVADKMYLTQVDMDTLSGLAPDTNSIAYFPYVYADSFIRRHSDWQESNGIRFRRAIYEKKSKRFTFEYVAREEVIAETVSEAVRIFQRMHTDIEQNDIKHVICESSGQSIPYQLSKKTWERIYYKPGCPFGETDCIMDPMYKIAEEREHQSDMTPDKWVGCDYPGPDDEDCSWYDDEDK